MKSEKISLKLEQYFKSIIIGTLIGIFSMFLFTLGLSLIPLKVDLPNYTYNILNIVSILISAFIAGYINGRKVKKDGIMVGFITSVLFIIIFLLLKLLFSNLYNFNFNTLLKLILIIFTCLVSSIIGVNKKNKRIRY